MNRTELIESMSAKSGLSKKDSDAALKAFLDTVTEEIKKGRKVQLVGFGTFETSKRAARTGKNPQTGEIINIPENTVPKFKAGSTLKNAASGNSK